MQELTMTYNYKEHAIQLIPAGNWYNIIINGDIVLEAFDSYFAAKLAAESIVDDLIS